MVSSLVGRQSNRRRQVRKDAKAHSLLVFFYFSEWSRSPCVGSCLEACFQACWEAQLRRDLVEELLLTEAARHPAVDLRDLLRVAPAGEVHVHVHFIVDHILADLIFLFSHEQSYGNLSVQVTRLRAEDIVQSLTGELKNKGISRM